MEARVAGFANQTGLKITVTHLLPGTSKWNKIGAPSVRVYHHELAGQAAGQHQVIVQLIGSTTTEMGLKVCCELDANLYLKGIKVSDEEMQAINITRDEFHGEWNYTISPKQQPP